jgi:triacylglycerol lipase
MARHHLYLSPGMFGFGRVASLDYFGHVERELARRFSDAGHELTLHVADVLPTASIRRRAIDVARLVTATCGTSSEAIHLLGHSTGGLDVRLVASPGAVLPNASELAPWLPRVRSVTMMNAPHYGTPLATFFATTRGQQALYLLSAFTFVSLSLGARPLALVRLLLGLFSRGERGFGMKIPLVDPWLSSVLNTLDDARSPEVRSYLAAIERDQGAVVQLTPEGMDLVLAGFVDRPGVLYQSTVSMSPPPGARNWLNVVRHPTTAASLTLFTALHGITARYDPRYPCSAMSQTAGQPALTDDAKAVLAKVFGAVPGLEDCDGVVPVLSQLWGKLVWAGYGDHLDVLGHYRDSTPETDPKLAHHDWMTSGSSFGDEQFAALMDTIAHGMLAA